MTAEATCPPPKVLIIGAPGLVLDNVHVLLRNMGYQCVTGSSIKEGLVLLEQEKPGAAILDTTLLASSPAEIPLVLHKVVLRVQGRAVVLTREDSDSQLPVLEAYSRPKVPVDLVVRELLPCLELLLHGTIAPRWMMRSARLIFDSALQPLPVGVRSAQPAEQRLLYESGDVMVDLWLELQRDSQRINLVGQILHEAKSTLRLPCAPVVLQSKAEPIEATTRNQLGEFQLDFDPHPH